MITSFNRMFSPLRGAVLFPFLLCAMVSGARAENAQAQQLNQASAATTPLAVSLAITPKKAKVGDTVQATAEGLPPGKQVALIWETVEGGWVIEDYYHFRGKKYSETTINLGSFLVGLDGRLTVGFTVPEDYGGIHNVVVSGDTVFLAQGAVDLTQSFEMSPTEGPLGTVIELQVKGLGWRTLESTWVVNWDNHLVGWVSAASSKGTATARFRATGPVGDHQIKVYTGWQGQSYLNFEQAPNAYLPRPTFGFRTTGGSAVPVAYVEPYPRQPVPESTSRMGARLTVNPTQGPVQTKVTLSGSGFPPGKEVSLVWETWVGSRVTAAGFDPMERDLGKLRVNADGSLDAPVIIPDDLGGLHALTIKAAQTVLARTYYVIETSTISVAPTSGPAGTPIAIHLKGVGWTEYDNIYVVNYDNAYMGYVCGFNSQGDVVVNFTASGAPGIHLIDFYPGIYQGPEKGQQLYRLPQLTYREDHPGNKIPALRFAFEVTPSY